jgi:hypothetical protein
MARAGLSNQAVISNDLLEEIHYRSQGIPRLINGICDNLLLTSFAMESKVATMEMLDEITVDMRLEYPSERPYQSDQKPLRSRSQIVPGALPTRVV